MINLHEKTISYDDICLIPRYSNLESRNEASIGYTDKFNGILVNSPMIHTSGVNMIKFLTDNKICTTVHRYFNSAEDQFNHVIKAFSDGEFKNDIVYFAVGRDQEWIGTLIGLGVKCFCVDMAHGDSKPCVDTITFIRTKAPDARIMAGNVATASGYRRLIRAGATSVRVGIAGGSICSTAKNTAFGVPMVTSIMECNKAKLEVGGVLIADGGIRSAADMLKAIAAGADMVMCGKLLASTSEAEGPFFNKHMKDVKTVKGRILHEDLKVPRFVEYAGMASHEMRMRNNSHTATHDTSIEGVYGVIEYTGTTDEVIRAINANLRAGLSYCGARDWFEFKANVEMRLMSTSGIIEKDTHIMDRLI